MADDEVLSALAIIYGFFLLFLSTLFAGLDWIPGALSSYGQELTYGAIWASSISLVLVGLEVWNRLHKKGLGVVGHIAMFPMNFMLPFFFLRFVGDFVLDPTHDQLRNDGSNWWIIVVVIGLLSMIFDKRIKEIIGLSIDD